MGWGGAIVRWRLARSLRVAPPPTTHHPPPLGSVFFGWNAAPLHLGVVRVGDALDVISARSGAPQPYVH